MRSPSGRNEDRRRLSAPLTGIGVMLLAASTLLVADHAAAVASPNERSCFLNGITQKSPDEAQAIERATIFIALVQSDGTLLSQGTGFVAASRAAGVATPRIVTAAHVVEHDQETAKDARLMAFFADGSVIGAVHLVASETRRTLSLGDFDIVAGDVAAVEIAQFADQGAEARFAQLPGLAIASGDRIEVGEASDPVGAIWGFSGAAAVDAEGRAIGVLTGASFRGRVTLELGSVQESNAAGRPMTRAVTLAERSLIVVEPLNAPTIAAALGTESVPGEALAASDVVLAGFPLSSCASTAATLASADSEAGVNLLARWQKIGPVGAWFLPPSLDQTKLKLRN